MGPEHAHDPPEDGAQARTGERVCSLLHAEQPRELTEVVVEASCFIMQPIITQFFARPTGPQPGSRAEGKAKVHQESEFVDSLSRHSV
jgi:hypothetical protein